MFLDMCELLVLLNQAVYCYSFFPLIRENYRIKSAQGISDLLIWMMFNSYVALGIYFFSLKSPFFYKLSVGLQLFFVIILIFQRFWYDNFQSKKLLLGVYVVNFMIAFGGVFLAVANPFKVGNIAGWLGLIFIVVSRIPQFFKIHKEQSVKGFSYGYALFLGMAALMEIFIVLYYRLPIQTLATALFAFLSFVVFSFQFYLFSWRKKT